MQSSIILVCCGSLHPNSYPKMVVCGWKTYSFLPKVSKQNLRFCVCMCSVLQANSNEATPFGLKLPFLPAKLQQMLHCICSSSQVWLVLLGLFKHFSSFVSIKFLIGESLSEPHTSRTAFCRCLCTTMLVAIYQAMDRPSTAGCSPTVQNYTRRVQWLVSLHLLKGHA